MTNIEYIQLQNINRTELLAVLNKERIREHLVSHELFDEQKLDSWIEQKSMVDSSKGCRVRGIIVANSVAGWGGIQFENGAYEIAIVLDERHRNAASSDLPLEPLPTLAADLFA